MEKLDTMATAVRAVWVLYQRRKWELLAELGIVHRHAAALEAATTDFETKLTDADVNHLVRVCPFVADAAEELLQIYRLQQLLKEVFHANPVHLRDR